MYNGRLYGNNSNGFGYSPDRSRDVDRFNIATRGNYSTSYNPNGYGYYNPYNNTQKNKGHYDGRGVWIED